jgi:hypothetical protein
LAITQKRPSKILAKDPRGEKEKKNVGILLWMGKKLELLFKLNPINLKKIKNKK